MFVSRGRSFPSSLSSSKGSTSIPSAATTVIGDDARQRADAARARASILRAQQIAARAAAPEPTAPVAKGAASRL